MSQEPLTLTLEEAFARGGWVFWQDPTSSMWAIGRIRLVSPHDPKRYSHDWEPVAYAPTWPEALAKAEGRPVIARDDVANLQAENWKLQSELEKLDCQYYPYRFGDESRCPEHEPCTRCQVEQQEEELYNAIATYVDAELRLQVAASTTDIPTEEYSKASRDHQVALGTLRLIVERGSE